jgi:Fe-S oxidoreductase
MLTAPEKIAFIAAVLVSLYLAWVAAGRIVRIIARGQGRPNWDGLPRKAALALFNTLTFAPVFRTRLVASLFHGLVSWGFIYYLLVNLGDVLEGYIPDFIFLGEGTLGDLFRIGADLITVGTLIGMLALLLRRFLFKTPALTVRSETLLHPKARSGIRRDSALVGIFILIHVGSRFVGRTFQLAMAETDVWEPVASAAASLWTNLNANALELGWHISWWLALGTILAFIPYFPYSKHIHLFFAPINFLVQPERKSPGALDTLDFDDESIEQFGAERLEHLSWKSLVDAYACIMCNRCQDACPAYETGKVLSPAAMEINKRYFLNVHGSALARGETSSESLLDFAIPAEAVWACTACGACNDICPVGNEPMRDIMEIRRHLVLMENAFPEQLQTAFRGMERVANPWNIAPEERLKWAEGLAVPTVTEKPEAELLWWVGCAPATDPRAQETARAFAKALIAANVDFAVLGSEERCTGDAARRAGNEYLFAELAQANVETLNRVQPKRIVTTCPHCLHTLATEYPEFGGNYEVIHHTDLLTELIAADRLELELETENGAVAFHDPCYLGRQNNIYDAPRRALEATNLTPLELPRNEAQSFCCGAGGAQMWKEEEHGQERVSQNRLREAEESGIETLAVGCPFCMIMLSDASKEQGEKVVIRDVAELVADKIAISSGSD